MRAGQHTQSNSNAISVSMYKSVIFDLGGVLIDWNPRYLYRKLFKDEVAMEHFLATVCTLDWNALQDAGRPVAEATHSLIRKWPGHAELIEAYYARWTEMLGGPIEGTVAVIDDLRARGVPLFALTNWSAETFPYVEHRYEFMEWFEHILVSGRVGLKKPDVAIFRLLLARCGIDVREAVFIDDSAANIAAAASIGLHAIRFTSATGLRSDLETLGIL